MAKNPLWQHVSRAGASLSLMFHFASAAKPPSLDSTARTRDQAVQWAQSEKTRRQQNPHRAVELGYQLREPDYAEYRPQPNQSVERSQPTATRHVPDSYDRALATRAVQPPSRDERSQEGRHR